MLAPGQTMPRHRHHQAYAAIVLSGCYRESGDHGRFDVEAGDVLFHDRFDSHRNEVASTGCTLLDLPLRHVEAPPCGRVEDPDEIALIAQTDPHAAVTRLMQTVRSSRPQSDDWPDLLARSLRSDIMFDLRDWGGERNLTPDRLTRDFLNCYGVTPHRYRAEYKASRAARALLDNRTARLADIAAEAGFSDQPHMTHRVKMLCGHTPAKLRTLF